MNKGESAWVRDEINNYAGDMTCGTDLDSVHSADGDTRDGHAGEDMTSDLEHAHGERALDDGLVRTAELGEADDGAHEKQTVGRDEAELDEGEGDGVAELHEDSFASVGG